MNDYNDNETVTMSLERYNSIQGKIKDLHETIDEFEDCFEINRMNGTATVKVNREKLEKWIYANFSVLFSTVNCIDWGDN